MGNLSRVALSFTGTNSPVDIVDYFQINAGTIAPNMETLLTAFKGYAEANGLSGEDTLVTGYSLGGAMVNIMARFRGELADGFFADADYIGHESPLMFDDSDVVFNYGYENDAVFRVAGDSPTFLEALDNQGPNLTHANINYDTTTDNIVLFGDMYGSPLWPLGAYSLLNIPEGWYAHLDGVLTDAIQRIVDSPFYEYTHSDSVVIVSSLSEVSRSTVWVEDKETSSSNHFGQPAFLIGTEHDDMIRGGEGSDFISAGGGDDLIRLSGGADRVDGGTGNNTLRLEGQAQAWEAYRLEDGTLFLNSTRDLGLKQVENIQHVEFEGWNLLGATSLINQRYSVGDEGLNGEGFVPLWLLPRELKYGKHVEGSTGGDELTGKVVFGGEGDDTLIALDNGSLLHGGEGNDTLVGSMGDDQLYGGEGDDALNVRGGDDVLYGGVGDDLFIFEAGYQGDAVIKDFNQHAGDQDWLVFVDGLFANDEELFASASQQGSDVVIAGDAFHITIEHIDLVAMSDQSQFWI